MASAKKDNLPAFMLKQLDELTPASTDDLGDYAEYTLVLLGCFNDLSSSRRQSNGPEPISYTDIAHYSDLMNIEFTSWEISVIKFLDRVYISTVNKHMQEEHDRAMARAQNG